MKKETLEEGCIIQESIFMLEKRIALLNKIIENIHDSGNYVSLSLGCDNFYLHDHKNDTMCFLNIIKKDLELKIINLQIQFEEL